MNHSLLPLLLIWPSLLSAAENRAVAQSSTSLASNKGQYHLFNPTPKELMREMSTDRPDATESPITVDAGHYQVESSFFDYSRDRSRGTRSEIWTYGSFNIKAGIFNNTDLQIVFDSYLHEKNKETEGSRSISGFSDIQMRLKLNLWGNEGEPTSLGLMPFVKIPSGSVLSNDQWEGGVIAPFAIEIMDGINVGLMAEADFVYDDISRGYEIEWVHTAVVGIELTEKLGTFIEYMGVSGNADEFKYQASFNTGLTYGLSDNVQLDAGLRLGLNSEAEDFGIFSGISIRY